MAEAVITSIAENIVAFLGSQAIKTVGKIWGIEREFELLKDTVSTLRPVLEHAEEQYLQSPQIKGWVENLKDALYDARDVYEEFDIEAKRQELRGHNEIKKKVRTFFSSSNQLAFKLKMSDKVRAVRERMEVIIKAGEVFHLEKRPVGSRVERQWRKREETYSYISEGDIKGRDDDKKVVKDFLLDPDVQENVSILPIVGIGGLGKTALAQYVYNDEIVSERFDLKMWVCVSDDFDVKEIVKNIIACANKKEPTEGAMELLQNELREKIDGKRYLLVLDDVWNKEPEAWLRLRTLLGGGARGSKILITTRIPLVAEIIGTAPPLFLVGLSEDASLDLLMQIARRKTEEIQDPDMLTIGKDIVRKCSGVPLIVRTVGSLLFFKKTKLEWLHFKDNELPEVSRSEDCIMSVLMLSYDHLPSHLKQCFALCSLFPKDCKINKQTLVDLWLAEGFIQPLDRSLAHGYFMDLLYSNFFQDYQEDKETCKMHDLMHDLACSVAGIECQLIRDGTKSIDKKTRHISVGDLPISQLKASSLRTFLLVSPYHRSEADLRQIIQRFKRLHILDFHFTYANKVPRSIGKLKYLTYLDLHYNGRLKRLPNSITRLQNLQTLNLRCCNSLEELPRGIRKLVTLQNLDIDYCDKLGYMPHGVGQLTSLQRLTRFILPKDEALAKNCCRLGELKGLNHVRGSLRIENLESVTDAIAESKEANLEGKQYLETLRLEWGYSNTGDAIIVNRDQATLDGLKPHPNLQKLTIDGYKGESFPRWMMDLPNLVELRLRNCGRCKHVPPLGRLSSLVDLSVKYCEQLESLKDESGDVISYTHGLKSLRSVEFCMLYKLASLPRWLLQANNLRYLLIRGCKSLKKLPEQIEALQSLQRLQIEYCPSLTSLPEGIRTLASLTSLCIHDCAELESSKDESGNVISDFHDGLNSLRSVEFNVLPKLASLPQWIPQASNLESLEICHCRSLKELPEQIEALQSLQKLEIICCSSLTLLPEGIRRLASLTSLCIWGCEELDLSKDESGNVISDFQGLKSLRSVKFIDLPKLASLPRWIPQASNLESLEIRSCHCLKELPEQIEALQSLQKLEISDCYSLKLLPEGMRRLASLTSQRIYGCPELEERRKRDAGEDWHKITHIPLVL